ncbi:hypothetical protein M1N60_02135 [Thermodesulfovibrionales bacterium]|nr:hypothetical protein [Thermodesulfovibrionales bacterium]
MMHPNEALYESGKTLPVIPSCEHFAGSEKLIGKALGMQEKTGPVKAMYKDTSPSVTVRGRG